MDLENIKKQVDEWTQVPRRSDDQIAHRIPELKKLSNKLQSIAAGMFGLAEDWTRITREAHHEYKDKAWENFFALPKAQRIQISSALIGEVARDLELVVDWTEKAGVRGHRHTIRHLKQPSLTAVDIRHLYQPITTLVRFERSILTTEWVTEWSAHLGYNTDHFGVFFASVIDNGGKTGQFVFNTLCQSLRKEHDIALPTKSAYIGLLRASNKEGWELVENMFLAAQRQEGLRQEILYAAGSAHPQAFTRLLRIIVDNNLTRFSSVVKSFDEWFNMQWSSLNEKQVKEDLTLFVEMLENDARTRTTIKSDDPAQVYLALRAMAFKSGDAALKEAKKLSKHKSTEHRFVAAKFIGLLGTEESYKCMIDLINDDDLRVAATAATLQWANPGFAQNTRKKSFDAMCRLVERAPDSKKKYSAVVWPWIEVTCEKTKLADQLPYSLGDLAATALVPYLDKMSADGRSGACRQFVQQKKWDVTTRDQLVNFAGDASQRVRKQALEALAEQNVKLTKDDIEQLSGYLTRTTSDLRAGVITALLNSKDAQVLDTTKGLLESKNKNQRLAGLELVRALSEANRSVKTCNELAENYRKRHKKLTNPEKVQLDAVLDIDVDDDVSFDDCLGFIDPNDLTPIIAPDKHDVTLITSATSKLVCSLDEFVHTHREMQLSFTQWNGDKTDMLLGEISYQFPHELGENTDRSKRELSTFLELLDEWLHSLDKTHLDSDGFHLLRAKMWKNSLNKFEQIEQFGKKSAEHKSLVQFLVGEKKPPQLKYSSLLNSLLNWLLLLNRPKKAALFCINAAETAHAMLPTSEIEGLRNFDEKDLEKSDFRTLGPLTSWTNLAYRQATLTDEKAEKEIQQRTWQLMRWRDKPVTGAPRSRPGDIHLAHAYKEGWVNQADVYDQLIGPHAKSHITFSNLRELTKREPRAEPLKEFVADPDVSEIIKSIVNRLLELELARGESDTTTTAAMLDVQSFNGVEYLIRLLEGLGKTGFVVTYRFDSASNNRPAIFSKLIDRCYPTSEDTIEDFSIVMKKAIKEKRFSAERLLQLAFFAPQWREHVSHALGWKGFLESMYWFMAHMKYISGVDDAFLTEEEIKQDSKNKNAPGKLSRFGKIIRERTPLTAAERDDGAIDVNWFRNTYEEVSPKRWIEIANAARFASTAQQARRAKMVAEVLLGKYPKKQLVEGITKRHLKENVRLLGLMPLARGARRDKDLHDRYEILQNYKKYAATLSSMTRPEAMRSVEIGMQNLASTAGFPDATRLQWALEAEATKDLAEGPVVVHTDSITVSLELDDEAQPVLNYKRGEKALKALPRAAAKDKNVEPLIARARTAKQQASRIKSSLEEVMIRCDKITGGELVTLADHALLWPQLEKLVLISDQGLGYPCKKGKALRDYNGDFVAVKKNDEVRIAHPYDLLKNKDWPKWQRDCFTNNNRQPFKQLFRELYLVTTQEKKNKDHSSRFAGHQINSSQSYALWASRGWSRDEYDNIWKAIYHEPINVQIDLQHGYGTPLQVEGLTLDNIKFTDRQNYKALNLSKIPAVLFSEVMRDIDLVVSVAHAGEVDPEATASTVEMRTALLKETCQLLKQKNVSFKADRAIVKGKLAEYSIHLGSGVVHKMPGGSVCIVPVHSQHRGRLFLPFADDDPRTAEVISKCLMLARDDEIDDPELLAQIRR